MCGEAEPDRRHFDQRASGTPATWSWTTPVVETNHLLIAESCFGCGRIVPNFHRLTVLTLTAIALATSAVATLNRRGRSSVVHTPGPGSASVLL